MRKTMKKGEGAIDERGGNWTNEKAEVNNAPCSSSSTWYHSGRARPMLNGHEDSTLF
jgi:hypothetical protein